MLGAEWGEGAVPSQSREQVNMLEPHANIPFGNREGY